MGQAHDLESSEFSDQISTARLSENAQQYSQVNFKTIFDLKDGSDAESDSESSDILVSKLNSLAPNEI